MKIEIGIHEKDRRQGAEAGQDPWFLLGLVPLETGLIGWCPPYALLGINTCRLGDRAAP